ncbi:hypothetical protein EON63_14055 [archaeon]|nr:MAG: hypothetical protein EON63_14055 [archaeon]
MSATAEYVCMDMVVGMDGYGWICRSMIIVVSFEAHHQVCATFMSLFGVWCIMCGVGCRV